MDNACFCFGQRLLLEISLCFTNQPFDIQIVSIECIYFVILAFFNWMKYLILRTNNITICCWESSKSVILTADQTGLDIELILSNYFFPHMLRHSNNVTEFTKKIGGNKNQMWPCLHLLFRHMVECREWLREREWCCFFLSEVWDEAFSLEFKSSLGVVRELDQNKDETQFVDW